MSNVSQINVGNNTYDIKDTTARSGLANKQDIIQKTTLPTASSTEEGNIYQYIGETGNGLTNGYFYKCVENSGVYSWQAIDVQAGGGGDISSKADKVSNATAGNFAGLDATGNLTDSGKKASDFEIASTATGTSITLTDSADGYVQGVMVKGHSEVVDGAIKSIGDAGWGIVDLGTVTWEKEQRDGFAVFVAAIADIKLPDIPAERLTGLICSEYGLSTKLAYAEMEDKSMMRNLATIVIKDSDYYNSDATAFKSAMNNVILYYPLADTTGATPTFGITSKNGAGQGTAATITTGLPLRSTLDGTVYDELTNKKVITRCEVFEGEVVPLATPVETPLTSAEIAALAALRTYDNVTHIDATDSPPMTIEYIKNTSNGKMLANIESKVAEKQNILQYSTMPTASAEWVGKIVQYTGSTTASYTNGYFYKCVPGSISGTYEWARVNVQPGGGGGDIIDDDNVSTETTYSSSKIEDICSGDDTPRWRKPYYVNGVKIVTFEDGTIQELKDMVNAHMAGTIDIYDYWHVGDCRRIKINAIPAVENYCDASPAQYVYATIVADYYPADHDVLFMVKIGSGLWNTYPMDDAGATLSDGFRSSKLNSYLQNQLFPAIEGSASTGFQSLLSPFTVRNFTSASTYVDDEVVMTLPSVVEFLGSGSNFEANTAGIKTLEYYVSTYSRIAYLVNKGNTAYYWVGMTSGLSVWIRSFYTTSIGYIISAPNTNATYLATLAQASLETSCPIIPIVAIKGGE